LLGRRQLEKLSLGYQTHYILSTRIPENIDEAGFFKKFALQEINAMKCRDFMRPRNFGQRIQWNGAPERSGNVISSLALNELAT
jgi:hypothetical protein